ncbi:MAG: aspartyl/asparaginyl beta-hydroxylase domain-containing protein, partial [Steroidobacteraceae bacterium]
RRAMLAGVVVPFEARHGPEGLARVRHALDLFLGDAVAANSDPRQQPSFHWFPGLPAAPLPDRSLFGWIPDLEVQASAIRAELEALLPQAAGRERVFDSSRLERDNLRGTRGAPDWSGYYFYRHGERRDENCRRCPRTAAALEALPLSHVREHGPEVLFSVFAPGTHLLPHRGVTNTRLVAHLPLLVPGECALRVADVQHAWREGEVVVFDDTYEHEAWNRSGSTRVVMIFDVWNPHLTCVEREVLAVLVPAIGHFRARVDAA